MAGAAQTGRVLIAVRLPVASERLLDPAAADWSAIREEVVNLAPTPLGSQPSRYVVNAWKDRPYGLVTRLSVAVAHNGEAMFFRLRWSDDSHDDAISDTDRFPDAAAVLFPVRPDAPLQSMGSPEHPVNAWYWRADEESPMSVTATGLGTAVRHKNGALSASAAYRAGGWQVVLSRPLVVRQAGVTQLRPGWTRQVAFAVWQGSNRERGGLKAVTMEWQTLEIQR